MKEKYCYEHERNYPCIECQERDEMTKSWYDDKRNQKEILDELNEIYFPDIYEKELEEND